MSASINEIARLAGVSTATVSRTFRDPELLSHTTRRKVLDVAEKMDYRPRRHGGKAASMAKHAPLLNSIGALYFASDYDGIHINEFYAPIVMAAQSEAARREMHLVFRTASRFHVPVEMPKMFRERSVAGVLLMGAALPEVMIAYDAYLPVSVLVDNKDAGGKHDCILNDGFSGVLSATKYLLELGHRNIAFVLDEPTAPSFIERRRGYLCALLEAGIAPNPAWLVAPAYSPHISVLEGRIAELLSSPQRATAVIAASDRIALSVLGVARKLALTIPDDLSVIGFDNNPFSLHTYPKLTTVDVDKELMGRLAVRQLLSRLEESRGNRALPPSNTVVPATLVRRDSCASPKRNCA